MRAAVVRTETELILKSRWVVPARLERAGYAFMHPDLEPALRSILRPAGVPQLDERATT